ncbi:MAG: MFS transporter [Sphaerochaeta sp.]
MLRFLLLNFFMQSITAIAAPYTQIIFRNKGYSNSLVGVIVAIGQIASVIIPVLACMIADKTRRTKLLAMLFAFMSMIMFIPSALSGSLVLTAVAFFLASGALWSLNPMVDGYQTRMFGGNSAKYGKVRAIGTVGYIACLVFFALNDILDEKSNPSILYCLVAIYSMFIIVTAFAPREPRPANEELRERKQFFSFKWFDRKFYLFMLVVGISRIGESVIEKLLSSYMTEELHLGGYFTIFVALGALSEVVMIAIGGNLLQKGKVKPYTLIMLSCVGLAVRLMIYWLFPNVAAFTFGQLLHSLTFGALHIGVAKFIAQDVKYEHYSLATSFYWAIATNLPEMFGVLAGGFVIDMMGYRGLFALYTLSPIIAFILGLAFKKTLISEATL